MQIIFLVKLIFVSILSDTKLVVMLLLIIWLQKPKLNGHVNHNGVVLHNQHAHYGNRAINGITCPVMLASLPLSSLHNTYGGRWGAVYYLNK